MIPNTKVCSFCKEDKDLEKFAIDKKGKFGRSACCKYCVLVKRGKTPKPKRPTARDGYKYCSKCGNEKLLSEFYPDKRASDGKMNQCKHCNQSYSVKDIGKFDHLKTKPVEPDGFRWCSECGEVKTVDQFQTQMKKGKPILRRVCILCRRKENLNYSQSHKNERKHYRVINKDIIKEASKEYNSRPDVREKRLERLKKKRIEDPRYYDNAAKISRAKKPDYYRKLKLVRQHRRRARQLALPNTLTIQQWNTCLEYFEYKCAVCGRSETNKLKLAADHWIALSDVRENNPGTVAANIIPLCHGESGCNNSKLNRDVEEWLQLKYSNDEVKIILKRIKDYFSWLDKDF